MKKENRQLLGEWLICIPIAAIVQRIFTGYIGFFISIISVVLIINGIRLIRGK